MADAAGTSRGAAIPPSAPAPAPNDSEATFESLGLHPSLLQAVRDLGFLRPTPIQAQAIPPILAGRDLIGCAETGTGKTAAFVLPIFQRLLRGQGRGHVRALVVAPTRELALQSSDQAKALSRHVPLTSVAVFGGVPMEPQIQALARSVDLISATPGRLLDHLYSARIDFVDLEVFVLDEVDRMLDMGFLPDVQRIVSFLPPARQTLVFSATLPAEIQTLVQQMLRDPVTVQIGRRSAPAAGIRHAVYAVQRHLKTDFLLALLRQPGMTLVLVFTRTKASASRLAQTLERKGVTVAVLHGDRSQSQRLRALDRFRRGRSQVMVATGLAARGLDIEDISHVINYDVPDTPDDYVHRAGRTARAEATGDALMLVAPHEEPMVAAIERALHRSLPRLSLPGFAEQPQQPPHPDQRHRGHDHQGHRQHTLDHARRGRHQQGHGRRGGARPAAPPPKGQASRSRGHGGG